MQNYNLISIFGPTATGKTSVAAHLAQHIGGEVISADSRQVYKGMDLGTGKDLEDYIVDGVEVKSHLIDVTHAGDKYNVYRFQQDFVTAFEDIHQREKWPIMCGGTGLYVESVLKGYKLINVPSDENLRKSLKEKTIEELTEILKQYGPLHNTTDVETKRRAIRAIEIQEYYSKHPEVDTNFPDIKSLNICVEIDRELRREKITRRLKSRLEEGMVQEVQNLLDAGVSADDLIYYGLEYKFVTLHVIGELTFDEMFQQLEIAIHQFAKRQMTWFRGMERRGISFNWLDATLPMEEKVAQIQSWLNDG